MKTFAALAATAALAAAKLEQIHSGTFSSNGADFATIVITTDYIARTGADASIEVRWTWGLSSLGNYRTFFIDTQAKQMLKMDIADTKAATSTKQ